MNNLSKIIQEEIKLFELRHVKVPTKSQWMSSDITTDTPLMDDETIRVYHGFYNFKDGLAIAKFGMSGKDRAKRIYSYESGNNPKGLFVSVQFDTVKRNFSGSGLIMEFSTKVRDLEAPVWVGGRSYYVQGEYTKSFKDDAEREEQQLANREKHAQSEYPAIANSDRPELAWALYDGPEKQALYTGDLNPNMIQAFWVNETLKNERRTNGPWVRMSRNEFMKKYYSEDAFKQIEKYGDGRETTRYDDRLISGNNKLFQPAEDFTVEALKAKLKEMEYDYDDFVETYIKRNDQYALKSHFYPKQLAQISKIYGI